MRKNALFEIARTVIAISIALILAIAIVFFVSEDPFVALEYFLSGPLKSLRHLGNVIEMAIPLTFTGLAVSVMFKANQFNLGAEGAFFAGAVLASIVAIKVNAPSFIHILIALILGGCIGSLVCYIPGKLKTQRSANELVSSLMLNYISTLLGIFAINYFFRDPKVGSMASYKFQKTAQLAKILSGTRIHTGLFVVIIAIFLSYVLIYRTKWGYEIRMTGLNQKFAGYSGMNTKKIIVFAQLIGGFIAGIGGATEILGMYTRFQWQTSPGYGWDGIIVAILARNNPLLVPVGAFLLAYIRIGADVMSRMTDVQNEVVAIIQGLMIMLITAESFLSSWKHKMIYKDAKVKITHDSDKSMATAKEEN